MKPYAIGLVGCGDIARKAYVPFLAKFADFARITACCDVRRDMAEKLAADAGIPRVADDLDALLADDSLDVILNLTHPAAHASVNLQSLRAGKHVYCEKPFALDMEEGKAVLEASRASGKLVGCAPDTVLGPGTQACRALIEGGAIGKPLFGKIHMGGAGHEHWHPNPAFYYQKGGGPMLDMGPYYLSTLVQLLGPIRSVEGRAVRGFSTRTIQSEPLKGSVVPVDTPTHYVGSMEMVSGAIIQVLFSFDLKFGADGTGLPEIYGTEGSLRCTDPNGFQGKPLMNKVYPRGELLEQTVDFIYEAGRGLGLIDLLLAAQENRDPRASGEMAFHLLEAMLGFQQSEQEGRRILLQSTCAQPAAMPRDGLRAE